MVAAILVGDQETCPDLHETITHLPVTHADTGVEDGLPETGGQIGGNRGAHTYLRAGFPHKLLG